MHGPWLVTVALHALLFVVAVAWVIVRYQPAATPSEPDCFAMPSAGASGAVTVVASKPRSTRVPAIRITSSSSESALALPAIVLGESGEASLLLSGGLKKGSVEGAGLGVKGLGIAAAGTGVGRIGKPVMGARIVARKIAVYLDCSGSMRPYLEKVEAEIRLQFPDADVFRFDGARVVVVDGEIADGKGFDGHFGTSRPGQSDPSSMTLAGRRLLDRIDKRCESGSLGAWIDWLLPEDYDGLVVFSDFQDGVRQYRKPSKGSPELIYADGSRRKLNERKEADARWEKAWLSRFGAAERGQGPRLYLFSIEVPPQPLLRQCAVASGGSVTMVEWLRGKSPR
jgi:hypothetical protein